VVLQLHALVEYESMELAEKVRGADIEAPKSWSRRNPLSCSCCQQEHGVWPNPGLKSIVSEMKVLPCCEWSRRQLVELGS
jgi:hypothetical protein